MTFTRTELGLTNEHLFHRVELVVYCEGEEIEGEGNSLDEAFWSRFFRSFGKTVICKSAGSKSNLRVIIQKILEDKIENTVVAMDRDYDNIIGTKIQHPKILYTHGYSWENDIIVNLDFDATLSLFATVANTKPLLSDYKRFFSSQSVNLKRVFAIDLKYYTHTEALFDRSKPVSIISYVGNSEPHIKRKELISRASSLGKFQTCRLPASYYRQACGVSNFHGKTVARLFYHWFLHRTKKVIGKRNIPYDAFISLLIAKLDLSDFSKRICVFYKNSIEAV